MKYQLPNYIIQENLNSPVIDYRWYDPDPGKELNYEFSKKYVRKLKLVGLRGKIALCIGIHEWVLGRFYRLTHEVLPYQLAEVAWCANVDVNYLQYFEFEPDQFIGPIDMALLYSSSCLREVLYVSNNVYDQEDVEDKDPIYYSYNLDEWKNSLNELIALTVHILPDSSSFKLWLDGVVARLIKHYTLPKPDPFDNLFGTDDEQILLGDYVPREVLDLSIDFDKQQTIPLINHYLENVNKGNPLLTSIEQLKKKISTPYTIQK